MRSLKLSREAERSPNFRRGVGSVNPDIYLASNSLTRAASGGVEQERSWAQMLRPQMDADCSPWRLTSSHNEPDFEGTASVSS